MSAAIKGISIKAMLVLLTLVLLFHLLVLMQIIPYEIVWAGKLNSTKEMFSFEIMSILVNLFLMAVLLLKGNFIKHKISEKLLNGLIWVFILLFSLNTIGNLFAKTLFEKIVFTPLTLISAIMLWNIVRLKSDIKSH